MDAYIVDWLSIIGRWVHLITGIAWIGASFYFIWLDNHLLPPKQTAGGDHEVGGELWAVHGGGFYHAQKYKLTPPALPETLHWFKWEAYWTWMSGVFLLALIYWYGAEIYLIDPSVADLSKTVGIVIGVGCLIVGWVVYDLLCKSPLGKNDSLLSGALLIFVSIAAYILCHVFGGRGAYIHFGAMLGTIMVANVAMVIMPGQRELVAATKEGRVPDSTPGEKAKQRSVHNTYFTLPVLFVMISNHYAMFFGHAYNWLILIAFLLVGALIRVYFVARHSGKSSVAPLILSAVIFTLVFVSLSPVVESDNTQSSVSFSVVKSIIEKRCTGCHSATPTQPGFGAAPNGIVFDTKREIVSQALPIHMQTVVTKIMPIANLTKMTDSERTVIDRWYRDGAKSE